MSEQRNSEKTPKAPPEVVQLGQTFLLFSPDRTEINTTRIGSDSSRKFTMLRRKIVLEMDGVEIPFVIEADGTYTRGRPANMLTGEDPDATDISMKDYDLEKRLERMRALSDKMTSPEGALLSIKGSPQTSESVGLIEDSMRLLVANLEAQPEVSFGQVHFSKFYSSDMGPLPTDPKELLVSSPGLPICVPSEITAIPKIQTIRAKFLSI